MKHSIICFISLMMTVFCYAGTSIYQLPSDSTDWKVYYMQGEEYHRKGKLQKSLSNYKKALSIHVSDTIVHALANCYYQRGYYQQSIELYNTFIKEDCYSNSSNLEAAVNRLVAYEDTVSRSKNYCVAMQDIENQNNTIALAQNFLSMEQPDSALTYLCRYTSIDSTDLNINRLKAYAYNQAGLHQDAIKLYQKIRQSGDRQASTEYYLGLSYAYTDSLSQAYDCLVRANNLSERKNAYILSQLGVIGSKIGMIKESQQDIKDALDLLQPDKQLVISLYETAATNHTQLHQYKDAIACYDKILKENPEKLHMLYQTAFLYGKLQQPEQEAVYYEKFIKAVEQAGKPKKYTNMLQDAESYIKELNVERFFQGKTNK